MVSSQRSHEDLQSYHDNYKMKLHERKDLDKSLYSWYVDHLKKNCNMPDKMNFNIYPFEDPFVALLELASGPKFLNFVKVELV